MTTFRTEYSGGTNCFVLFFIIFTTYIALNANSLTFPNIHFSLTFNKIPWLLPSLEFPWLFPDRWTPCCCIWKVTSVDTTVMHQPKPTTTAMLSQWLGRRECRLRLCNSLCRTELMLPKARLHSGGSCKKSWHNRALQNRVKTPLIG